MGRKRKRERRPPKHVRDEWIKQNVPSTWLPVEEEARSEESPRKMMKHDDNNTNESNHGTDTSVQKQDPQNDSVKRRVESLVHAAQCREKSCSLTSCRKIKLLSRHVLKCELKISGDCASCKNLTKLRIYHAKFCEENSCPLPFCSKLKRSLQSKQKGKGRADNADGTSIVVPSDVESTSKRNVVPQTPQQELSVQLLLAPRLKRLQGHALNLGTPSGKKLQQQTEASKKQIQQPPSKSCPQASSPKEVPNISTHSKQVVQQPLSNTNSTPSSKLIVITEKPPAGSAIPVMCPKGQIQPNSWKNFPKRVSGPSKVERKAAKSWIHLKQPVYGTYKSSPVLSPGFPPGQQGPHVGYQQFPNTVPEPSPPWQPRPPFGPAQPNQQYPQAQIPAAPFQQPFPCPQQPFPQPQPPFPQPQQVQQPFCQPLVQQISPRPFSPAQQVTRGYRQIHPPPQQVQQSRPVQPQPRLVLPPPKIISTPQQIPRPSLQTGQRFPPPDSTSPQSLPPPLTGQAKEKLHTPELPKPPIDLLLSLLKKESNNLTMHPQALTDHERALLEILRANHPLMSLLRISGMQRHQEEPTTTMNVSPQQPAPEVATKQVGPDGKPLSRRAQQRLAKRMDAERKKQQEEKAAQASPFQTLITSLQRMDMHRALLLGLETGMLIGLQARLDDLGPVAELASLVNSLQGAAIPQLQQQLAEEQHLMTTLLCVQMQNQQGESKQVASTANETKDGQSRKCSSTFNQSLGTLDGMPSETLSPNTSKRTSSPLNNPVKSQDSIPGPIDPRCDEPCVETSFDADQSNEGRPCNEVVLHREPSPEVVNLDDDSDDVIECDMQEERVGSPNHHISGALSDDKTRQDVTLKDDGAQGNQLETSPHSSSNLGTQEAVASPSNQNNNALLHVESEELTFSQSCDDFIRDVTSEMASLLPGIQDTLQDMEGEDDVLSLSNQAIAQETAAEEAISSPSNQEKLQDVEIKEHVLSPSNQEADAKETVLSSTSMDELQNVENTDRVSSPINQEAVEEAVLSPETRVALENLEKEEPDEDECSSSGNQHASEERVLSPSNQDSLECTATEEPVLSPDNQEMVDQDSSACAATEEPVSSPDNKEMADQDSLACAATEEPVLSPDNQEMVEEAEEERSAASPKHLDVLQDEGNPPCVVSVSPPVNCPEESIEF